MKSHFYNTINLAGADLATERAKNMKQEEMILRIFRWSLNNRLSPSQIYKLIPHVYNKTPPITSIRRALTDLTKQGLLTKTSHMVKGMYHLREHTWAINTNYAA